jgi:hypothetical protein
LIEDQLEERRRSGERAQLQHRDRERGMAKPVESTPERALVLEEAVALGEQALDLDERRCEVDLLADHVAEDRDPADHVLVGLPRHHLPIDPRERAIRADESRAAALLGGTFETAELRGTPLLRDLRTDLVVVVAEQLAITEPVVLRPPAVGEQVVHVSVEHRDARPNVPTQRLERSSWDHATGPATVSTWISAVISWFHSTGFATYATPLVVVAARTRGSISS